MHESLRTAPLLVMLLNTAAQAMDINDELSVAGTAAVLSQCQNVSGAPGFRDTCKTAGAFQPELSFRPVEDGEFFLKLGFGAGDGINGKSPFAIAPWAADLESDVRSISGRDRDHLLTAWYAHTFRSSEHGRLRASVGLIDATDYLDENAYANDEYTQFLHPALTNGPNVFLPSYDAGAALDWANGAWALRAVVMDVGENDSGNDFRFYGVQAGYTVNSRFGTGNYRLIIAGASADFADPTGSQLERRAGGLLSLDQEFGPVLGGWVRIGWQTDEAAVDYKAIYSGGIDIKGAAWKRSADNIGLGYARLDGGSLDIDESHVAEAYYRWQLDDVFALTADVQYQRDDYRSGGGPRGWMWGLRLTAEF